jgi:hypothetical protein
MEKAQEKRKKLEKAEKLRKRWEKPGKGRKIRRKLKNVGIDWKKLRLKKIEVGRG